MKRKKKSSDEKKRLEGGEKKSGVSSIKSKRGRCYASESQRLVLLHMPTRTTSPTSNRRIKSLNSE
jgi:hypothetical protein